MSKARLVLTALLLDRQTPAEVAARYGVHRSWVYKLKARYQTDGDAAFEPRSRRPHTSPTAIPAATVALIVELRDKLTTAGLDAGPDTIAWHLAHHHDTTVSASTISRDLTRAGLVTQRRRSDPSRPTTGSPPPCPTRAGKPTSPPTGSPSPTARPAPTPRS
jgi:transposase